MQITARGVLLLGAVALIVLKLAGVLTWPWLAVLAPILFYLLPYIWTIASGLTIFALGVMVLVGITIAGAYSLVEEAFAARRQRLKRGAALKAGAAEGPWDYPA